MTATQLTQAQQEALDFTLGRATNENLERAVGVHFKSEWEDENDGAAAGPVFLIVQDGDEPKPEDLTSLLAQLRDTEMVPVREGDDAEWFTEHYAERLAEALGVPLWSL